MPHLLFADFRKDRGSYQSAQRYWETLWAELQPAINGESPWTVPWMNNPSLDGNPMFTAVCWPLLKGVRIIQEEPGDPEDIDLDWWLNDFGDEDEDSAVVELVIACCPSVENIPQVQQLLKQWIQDDKRTLPQPNAA
jgi:hypothetical protein